MLLPFAASGDNLGFIRFLCARAAWHCAVGTPGWDECVDEAAFLLGEDDVCDCARWEAERIAAPN
jgi:hypothetical protein